MQHNELTLKEQVERYFLIDQERVKPGVDFSWPYESYQSEIVNEESRFFEWTKDKSSKSLDGFVIARIGYDGECEIMHMACRQKGCGYDMLVEWMAWARLQNIKKVFLEFHEKNIPAQTLYEELGFKKISERSNYYRDGGKAILMSLVL